MICMVILYGDLYGDLYDLYDLYDTGSTSTVKNYGLVIVVLTLTRIIKSVVTGQAPVTLKLRKTPGKTHTTQGGTRIHHS